VKVSFLQIYKEKVFDLLNPVHTLAQRESGKGEEFAGLRMRWHPTRKQFYVENLFECECSTPDEVLEHYGTGIKNKHVASTAMNVASSRSHTILLITLVRRRGLSSTSSSKVVSKLALVDLAGSERASSSTAMMSSTAGSTFGGDKGNARFQEAVQINQSLFVLRKVITALSKKQGSDSRHVPYRESKLTSLLQHSIGGNSFLVMLACLSPADKHAEENLSTLQYASQAANIKNEPIINLDPKDRLIQELRSQLAAAHRYILREMNLDELPAELLAAQALQARHPCKSGINVPRQSLPPPPPPTAPPRVAAAAPQSGRCRPVSSSKSSTPTPPMLKFEQQQLQIPEQPRSENVEVKMRATAPAGGRRPFTSGDTNKQVPCRALEASASPFRRNSAQVQRPTGRVPPKATPTSSKAVASPRACKDVKDFSTELSLADSEGRDLFSAADALLSSYQADSPSKQPPIAAIRRRHSGEGGSPRRTPRSQSAQIGGLPPVAPGPSPYKAELSIPPQPRSGRSNREAFEAKESPRCRLILSPTVPAATTSNSEVDHGGTGGRNTVGGPTGGGATTRSTTATSCNSQETGGNSTPQHVSPIAEQASHCFVEYGAMEELQQLKAELEVQLSESQAHAQQLQAKVQELQFENKQRSELTAGNQLIRDENESLRSTNRALQERLDIFFCAMELEGEGCKQVEGNTGENDAARPGKQVSPPSNSGIGERIERLHSQLVLEAANLRNEVAGLKKKKWILRAMLANGRENEQRAIAQEVERLRRERGSGKHSSPKKEMAASLDGIAQIV
jgi:hypothetical protein